MLEIALILAFACLSSSGQTVEADASCSDVDQVTNTWRMGHQGVLTIPVFKKSKKINIVIVMNKRVKSLLIPELELKRQRKGYKFFYRLRDWVKSVNDTYRINYVMKSMDEYDGANWQNITFGKFFCKSNGSLPFTQPPQPTFAPSGHFEDCKDFVTENSRWNHGWTGRMVLPNQGNELISVGLKSTPRDMQVWDTTVNVDGDVYSFQSFRNHNNPEVGYGFLIGYDAKRVGIKFIKYGTFSCGDVSTSPPV